MGLMGLVGLMGLMGLLLNVKMFVQKEHVILPQMLLNRNAKNATIATMLLMPRVTIMLMPPPKAIQAPIQTWRWSMGPRVVLFSLPLLPLSRWRGIIKRSGLHQQSVCQRSTLECRWMTWSQTPCPARCEAILCQKKIVRPKKNLQKRISINYRLMFGSGGGSICKKNVFTTQKTLWTGPSWPHAWPHAIKKKEQKQRNNITNTLVTTVVYNI